MPEVSDQYHFHGVPVQRAKGESLVDKIMYAARGRGIDERTGTVIDYSDEKNEVLATRAVGMKCAPAEFANRIEKREKASNAVLAFNIDASLPWVLQERNAEVMELFQQRVYERWKLPSFGALQRAPKRKKKLASGEQKSLAGDARNYHAHIAIALRAIDEKGNWAASKFRGFDKNFGQKREVEAVVECRKLWAEAINEKLEQYAYAERWSHLSYADRGIDQEAGVHLGQAATYSERTGKVTKRGERNRRVKARNAARKAAKTTPPEEKPTQETKKISAASAAQLSAPSQVTPTPPNPQTVHAPITSNPPQSPIPASTKKTRKKLTQNDRERIAQRLEQIPALADPFAQRTRSRSRQADDRKRIASDAAKSRRGRGAEAEQREREATQLEQRLALATGATQSAIQRTRRARGKRDQQRLAAKKAAARKAAPMTAAEIEAKAAEIKQRAAEEIANAAPEIRVLSLFDTLNKPRSR